jgi:hypothetical protein
MSNPFYQAALEGRWDLRIDSLPLEDGYVARYVTPSGREIEAVHEDQSEAHRQVTAKVMELIQLGELTPTTG